MDKREKTGGREKGTPNKTTSELKSRLQIIIEAELETLETVLSSLDPKERLEMVIKMLPYVMPKQNHFALNHKFDLLIPALNLPGDIPDIGNRQHLNA